MTKHKEKEEDIIEQKDIEKEAESEAAEIEHIEEDFEMKEKLVESEKKAAEYLNNWKRAVADFENYKKRQTESNKEFAKFAGMDLILQILPVLDNFHASTDHIPEDQKNNQWVVGIMHIQKQLEKVLEDNGVSEIEVKIGDKFNPEMHEAISNDAEEKELKNKVAKVIQKGYRMGPARNASHSDAGGDKIIRPARVIVE